MHENGMHTMAQSVLLYASKGQLVAVTMRKLFFSFQADDGGKLTSSPQTTNSVATFKESR